MNKGILAAVALIIGVALGALIGGGLAPQQVKTVTETATVEKTVTATVERTVTETRTVERVVTAAPPALREADVERRRVVGSLLGRYFLPRFREVAVVAQPDRLCLALASSALAGMQQGGYLVIYNATSPATSAQAAARADAVFLAFGGENDLAAVDAQLRDFLAQLAARGYTGALIFNARAWAAVRQFEAIQADNRIAAWAREREIYVLSFNGTHLVVLRYMPQNRTTRPVLTIDARRGEPVLPYTAEEALFLRAAGGRTSATLLYGRYNKVAIVTSTDPACMALTASAFATSRANITRIYVFDGNADALAAKLKAFQPDAVHIVFGGDMPPHAISEATRSVLTALKSINYTGDVLIHPFILRPTQMLRTVLDRELAQWLSQRVVRGTLPDPAEGRVHVVKYAVRNNALEVAEVEDSRPIPPPVLEILRKMGH